LAFFITFSTDDFLNPQAIKKFFLGLNPALSSSQINTTVEKEITIEIFRKSG